MTLALAPAALVRPRSRWWEPRYGLSLLEIAQERERGSNIPTPLPNGAGVWWDEQTMSLPVRLARRLEQRAPNPIVWMPRSVVKETNLTARLDNSPPFGIIVR